MKYIDEFNAEQNEMKPHNIVSINGKDKTTVADCIDLPSDLELFAKRIRAGEVNAIRAVIVYESADTRIHNMALGSAVTLLEAVGFLAWASSQMLTGTWGRNN